jgi:uncharacterized protein YrrD
VNISGILGRGVMDLATATTVGRVDDVVIDAATRRVIAFRIGKVASSGTWLPFEQITALGADAITVSDAGLIVDTPADAPLGIVQHKALGGRVLTEQGREIGPLHDVDVDETGAVTGLDVAGGVVAAADLLGIGSYATVVADRDASH